MKLKLWDNLNQRWLQINTIYWNNDGQIWKIEAFESRENYNAFQHGWYTVQGKDLDHVAIDGNIKFNTHLIH